jgi:Flp pilus assembly protein TadD
MDFLKADQAINDGYGIDVLRRDGARSSTARAVPPPGSGVRVMAAAAEALLRAHRGELEQAEAFARTAVATAETRTDNFWWQATTHEDLATVLERAGQIDEAREEHERSLVIWERKGCLPCAQRVRDRIDSLGRGRV